MKVRWIKNLIMIVMLRKFPRNLREFLPLASARSEAEDFIKLTKQTSSDRRSQGIKNKKLS